MVIDFWSHAICEYGVSPALALQDFICCRKGVLNRSRAGFVKANVEDDLLGGLAHGGVSRRIGWQAGISRVVVYGRNPGA
jgi:hypothetical protein